MREEIQLSPGFNAFIDTEKGLSDTCIIVPHIHSGSSYHTQLVNCLNKANLDIDIYSISKDESLIEEAYADKLNGALKNYRYLIISGKGTVQPGLKPELMAIPWNQLLNLDGIEDHVFKIEVSDSKIEKTFFIESIISAFKDNNTDGLVHQLQLIDKSIHGVSSDRITLIKPNVFHISNFIDNYEKWMNFFDKNELLGFDYETSELPWEITTKLTMFSVSSKNYSVAFWLSTDYLENEVDYKNTFNKVRDFLHKFDDRLVAYNSKFEFAITKQFFDLELKFKDSFTLMKIKKIHGSLKKNAVRFLNIPEWNEEIVDIHQQYSPIWKLFNLDTFKLNGETLSYAKHPLIEQFMSGVIEYTDDSLQKLLKPAVKDALAYLTQFNEFNASGVTKLTERRLFQMAMDNYTDWMMTPRDLLGIYCCYDSYYTLLLWYKFYDEFKESYHIYQGQTFISGLMECYGVGVNWKVFQHEKEHLYSELCYHYTEIFKNEKVRKRVRDNYVNQHMNDFFRDRYLETVQELWGIKEKYKYVLNFIDDNANEDERCIDIFYKALSIANPRFAQDKQIFLDSLSNIKEHIKFKTRDKYYEEVGKLVPIWDKEVNEIMDNFKSMEDGVDYYNPLSNDSYHLDILLGAIKEYPEVKKCLINNTLMNTIDKIIEESDKVNAIWEDKTAEEKRKLFNDIFNYSKNFSKKVEELANSLKTHISNTLSIIRDRITPNLQVVISEFNSIVNSEDALQTLDLFSNAHQKYMNSKESIINSPSRTASDEVFLLLIDSIFTDYFIKEIENIRKNLTKVNTVNEARMDGEALYAGFNTSASKTSINQLWGGFIHTYWDSPRYKDLNNPENYPEYIKLLYHLTMIKRIAKVQGTYLYGKSVLKSMVYNDKNTHITTDQVMTRPILRRGQLYDVIEDKKFDETHDIIATTRFNELSLETLRWASDIHTLPKNSNIMNIMGTRRSDTCLVHFDAAI